MIQWFPGHMAKARREMEENLKLVDVVIELLDARAPHASQNPMLQKLVEDKQKVILLMKSDLADPAKTDAWIDHFNEQGAASLRVNVNDRKDIANVIHIVNEKGMEAQQKWMEKGVKQRAVRALIAGVPNVGKSTLINRLANKRIDKIGDRPGGTKQQKWIKIKRQFDHLDTAGSLWPKFEDEAIGRKLAAIGTIKHELIPLQDVAAFVIDCLHAHYHHFLEERYDLHEHEDMWDTFVHIGKKRGALESGGHVNFDKVAEIVLQDFRSGRLGNITLEIPSEGV